MSTFRILIPLFLFVLAVYSPQVTAAQPDKPQLGINLSGTEDWSSELPFMDMFRMSRQWISQQKGAAWGKGPELELDEQGWVKRLQPDCYAETILCTINGGHYPSGEYTVFFDGNGEIVFSNAASIKEMVRPGMMRINVDSVKGSIFLRIMKTDPANPIRNIRVLMPGCGDYITKEGQIDYDKLWNPAFLKRWKGFTAFRFMDWMHTNNSKIVSWEDRPRLFHATWTSGIPLEIMCDFINRLEADAWFCMPHLADDRYIKEFATQTKKLLDPKRNIYIEYSNEVWNSQFAQNRYAGEKGIEMKLAEKPWEGAWRYTAIRSKQIFTLWYEVFGEESSHRLVRVLATQAANPYVSDRILETEEAGKFADALAVAPYVSHNIPQDQAAKVAAGGLDSIFEHMTKKGLPQSIDWIKRQKASADKYQLALICYEAGQHMVGIQGGENNEDLTKLLHAANRDARMGKIYTEYYKAWQEFGGGLLCHFCSISTWSKWGSWGIAEYMDEEPDSIPKYKATLDWAESLGQRVERDLVP